MSPSRVALLTLGLAFLAACGGDTQSGSLGDAELARDLSLAPAESVAQLDDRPPEQPRPRPRPPAPQPRREPPPPPPPEPAPEPPATPTVEQGTVVDLMRLTRSPRATTRRVSRSRRWRVWTCWTQTAMRSSPPGLSLAGRYLTSRLRNHPEERAAWSSHSIALPLVGRRTPSRREWTRWRRT